MSKFIALLIRSFAMSTLISVVVQRISTKSPDTDTMLFLNLTFYICCLLFNATFIYLKKEGVDVMNK